MGREDLASMFGQVLGGLGAIGFDDVHGCAAAGEFGRNQVAGNGGARQKNAAACEIVRGKGFEKAFGDVLLAHQIDLEMDGFNRGSGGGANGTDSRAELAEIVRRAVQGVQEIADAVGAGEDEPIVRSQLR